MIFDIRVNKSRWFFDIKTLCWRFCGGISEISFLRYRLKKLFVSTWTDFHVFLFLCVKNIDFPHSFAHSIFSLYGVDFN